MADTTSQETAETKPDPAAGDSRPGPAAGENGTAAEDAGSPPPAAETAAEAAAKPPEEKIAAAEYGLSVSGSGLDMPELAVDSPLPAGDPVLLEERYEIFPGKPVTEFDSPSAKAYMAEDRNDPGRPLFALICIPGMPARVDAMTAISGKKTSGLLPLVDFNGIFWPPFGRRCLAVIFQRPLGGRVFEALSGIRRDYERIEVIRRIVSAVSEAIENLMAAGHAHRGIRPANLYFLDAEKQQIVLGDSVTAPAGFDQPVVFETIERGMASPAARGDGDSSDDMYALGVTLMFLFLGRDPLRHLDEAGVLLAKLNAGTYPSLIGRAAIPIGLVDIFRGLLHDGVDERWGLDEIEIWLDKKRVQPAQAKAIPKAQRGFEFGGEEYHTVRPLSFAMSLIAGDALAVIKDGTLELWLLRGIEDKDLASAVSSSTAASAKSDAKTADAILLTRVLSLMDPEAPIRYKGFSFLFDGFGAAFAVETLRTGSAGVTAEVVTRNIPQMWTEMQATKKGEYVGELRNFAQLSGFLRFTEPGYGPERCLYELNPGLPCQSPSLTKSYVLNIQDLLPALEDAAKSADKPDEPIDRHIAAFVGARFGRDMGAYFSALGRREQDQIVLGMLSLLARLQQELGPKTLFGLASWMGGLMGPAVEVFQSRTTREALERELPKLVRKGALPEILAHLNDAEARRTDEYEFRLARAKFMESVRELMEIEEAEAPGSEVNIRKGQQSAAIMSVVIAMMVISLILIL